MSVGVLQRQTDENFLKQAITLAEKCRGIPFYKVGAIIVSASGEIISTGFTGELQITLNGKVAKLHAEETSIRKASEGGAELKGATLYTTMEPCSERKSDNKPCAQLVIENAIARVVYGAREPFNPELNIVCQGHRLLEESGIEVVQIVELQDACLDAARAST